MDKENNINQNAKTCLNCQKENDSNDQYCKYCGFNFATNLQTTLQTEKTQEFPINNQISQTKSNSTQNKKIWLLIIPLILLFCFVFISIASITIFLLTRCEHEWTDATCTSPKTCSLCEKTEGEALGHDWLPATCSAPKTCVRCEKTEGVKLEHTPGEWSNYSNYTTAKNISNKYCTVCDELLDTKTISLNKLHNNKIFLFSPTEFTERLEDKLDSIANNNLSASDGNSDDSYACIIHQSTNKVGGILFLDDSTMITTTQKYNACFNKFLGTVEDLDNIVRVFVALVETCDPTLDLDDAKGICLKAIEDGSYSKNGIKYVYVEDGNSAYIGATLDGSIDFK